MKYLKENFEGEQLYIHNGMVLVGNRFDTFEACLVDDEISKLVRHEIIDLQSNGKELTLNEVLSLDRIKVARFRYKEVLDELIDGNSFVVDRIIAKHKYDTHMNVLVSSDDIYTRREVAKCNNPDIIGQLSTDKDFGVLFTLLEYNFNYIVSEFLTQGDARHHMAVATYLAINPQLILRGESQAFMACQYLFGIDDFDILSKLASIPFKPTLIKLLQNKDKRIADIAAKTLSVVI